MFLSINYFRFTFVLSVPKYLYQYFHKKISAEFFFTPIEGSVEDDCSHKSQDIKLLEDSQILDPFFPSQTT